MKLFQKAQRISAQIMQAIKQHPFNQQLMAGTLATDTFAYYIGQDTAYLQSFAKCHAMLAAKAPPEYKACFARHANYACKTEQEKVHQFFRSAFNVKENSLPTPATLCYTSHLLHTCANKPVEVGIAAVVPCFWVYREVGLYSAHNATQHNPYARWIENYASAEFGNSLNEIINIFDALAAKTTFAKQQAMLGAFFKSTCFEWHFWNDAYCNRDIYTGINNVPIRRTNQISAVNTAPRFKR